MYILGSILAVLAGIGSLTCFIIVLVHFFNSEQTGLGIACIVLVFICGIGGIVAYVKGWMDGLGNIMWIWTACIGVGIVGRILMFQG